METKLDERLSLVLAQSSEDFRGVQKVRLGVNSVDVPCQQGEVDQERPPVAADEEKSGEESVDHHLGENVPIETVAQVNGVDVVHLQITVHDREEHL